MFWTLTEVVSISLEPFQKVLVGFSVRGGRRYEVAPRMNENNRLLESREQLSAHVVRDDFVLQTKHVQGGRVEGNAVEYLVLLARAAETGDNDGEAEGEVWLQSTLLERAQHGHEGGALAEAQDAIKGALLLHSLSHRRHAVVEPQALVALMEGVEHTGLDVRKPPSPGGLITSSSWTRLLLRAS